MISHQRRIIDPTAQKSSVYVSDLSPPHHPYAKDFKIKSSLTAFVTGVFIFAHMYVHVCVCFLLLCFTLASSQIHLSVWVCARETCLSRVPTVSMMGSGLFVTGDGGFIKNVQVLLCFHLSQGDLVVSSVNLFVCSIFQWMIKGFTYIYIFIYRYMWKILSL